MQLFVTSPQPDLCAKVLDDGRVNKMITESAQLLSTAMYINGVENPPAGIYNPHGRLQKWIASHEGNFIWVIKHYMALNSEWHKRGVRTKRHEGFRHIHDFVEYVGGTHKLKNYYTTPFINYSFYNKDTNPDGLIFTEYKLTLLDKWKEYKKVPKWYGYTLTRNQQIKLLQLNQHSIDNVGINYDLGIEAEIENESLENAV